MRTIPPIKADNTTMMYDQSVRDADGWYVEVYAMLGEDDWYPIRHYAHHYEILKKWLDANTRQYSEGDFGIMFSHEEDAILFYLAFV